MLSGGTRPTVPRLTQHVFEGGSGYSRAKHDPEDTRRKSKLEPRKSWPWIGRGGQVSERGRRAPEQGQQDTREGPAAPRPWGQAGVEGVSFRS